MDVSALIGDWDIGLREFTILAGRDGVTVLFPEAPPGYEGRLVAIGADAFAMEGGPYPGAEIRLGENGEPTLGGTLALTRLDRPAAPQPGSGLRAPRLDIGKTEDAGFAALWARIDHPSESPELDLGSRPAHRFVQWLMERDLVIFHGSNRTDLGQLEPVRRSMEVANTAGRGNLGAVYGTHDGLWSMFFAIVDRSRLAGSIRNGVDRHHPPQGSHLDLYHFSIHHEWLPQRPFTSGALYLLPRDNFEQLPLYPGGPPSPEWACSRSVRPLAHLVIEPEAFPFLDQIGGHDDGLLIEFEQMVDAVYDGVVSARTIRDGVEIVTSTERATVERLIELSRQFFPDVERLAADHPDGVSVAMTGPAAFQYGIRRRFAEMLEDDG